ncbi:hypothetical protein [Brevibacterium sp. ZH18]|uniref:hypothetical protein n=1 Tax=Brevibacterium sp. ZH18 TaxID=2927784 RepID=UPI001F606B43|nr:hypothetical protein [Brevibacterium sp. ZH18]MCI4010972.1 hypothetical protein [Brevibacterium sp. ZH18]
MPLSGRTLPVSSELRWLLDQWRSDGRLPVPEAPRPASAIVLIRDTLDGLETYITRQIDARGVEDRNRWAYPVGSLRPGDLRKLPCAGWNSARCARALSIDNKSRALHHFSAAARVAFAATGILLAEDVDRDVVASPQADWRGTRSRLFSSEISWSQILRERDLRLRPDLCKPWLRWINTSTQLHRFDTTFFLATVPFGQDVDFLSPNETSGGWKRPEEVLSDAGGDPDRISASTTLIAESLLEVPTVGAAMAQVRDVHPLRPEVIDDNGDWRVVIQPGRDLYRKGTLRDYAVAVGDDENDQSPGFLSQGDDDDDSDVKAEETDDR